MSLINRLKSEIQQPNRHTNFSEDNLEKHEIAAILNLIKSSSFQGEDIEMIYTLVIKLQNQYNRLENDV